MDTKKWSDNAGNTSLPKGALTCREQDLVDALTGILRHFRWNGCVGNSAKFDLIKRNQLCKSIEDANNTLANIQNQFLLLRGVSGADDASNTPDVIKEVF